MRPINHRVVRPEPAPLDDGWARTFAKLRTPPVVSDMASEIMALARRSIDGVNHPPKRFRILVSASLDQRKAAAREAISFLVEEASKFERRGMREVFLQRKGEIHLLEDALGVPGNERIVKRKEFDVLSSEVRSLLERGKVLITSSNQTPDAPILLRLRMLSRLFGIEFSLKRESSRRVSD